MPRKRVVDDGWTPELQREFISRLAVTGSPGRACEEMGKNLSGMMKLYRSPLAASFRDAWSKAVELAKRRKTQRRSADVVIPGSRPPSLDSRRKGRPACSECGREHPTPEEEAQEAWRREGEEAKARVLKKIDRLRRRELLELRGNAEKMRAYEVLNGPVDWDNVETYSVFGETVEALRRRM